MSNHLEKPTNVRYGVLGFACVLSMITYLDRVCFGTVYVFMQREFHLSDEQKGWIFGAFTLAYAAFEVPTGWLGDVFGTRKTLIRIVLWWSAFTALTGLIYPGAFAFLLMLSVRFLFGIGEAGAYPNIARVFHSWFPVQERGFAKGAVWMAGRFAGGVSPIIVLALVYQHTGDDGQPVTLWRHIFWIFGLVGVVWCVAFWLWFREHPEQHPSVNDAELAIIRSGDVRHRALAQGDGPAADALPSAEAGIKAGPPSLGPSAGIQEGEPASEHPATDPAAIAQTGHHDVERRLQVPWGKLLGSTNLWLLCLMYFCAAYGWYFNITYLPGYLVSQFKMRPSGWEFSIMAGLPLLFGSMACLIGGLLTDAFIKRTGDRKWGRRLFGIIGHSMCAVCYFLSMTVNNPWLFVLFVALASFWNDITMGAAWASCIDIGKRYSGIVSGCMNTIGNLGGFMANVITGFVLNRFTAGLDPTTQADEYAHASQPAWFINFLIFTGVYIVATFLWMGFDATKAIDTDEPGK